VDFTCETVVETGTVLWRAYIDLEFSVASDGSITGSGAGEFTEASCTLHGCTCEFTELGPISAEISGSRQGEVFHMSIRPSANMVQMTACPEAGPKAGAVDQIVACASVAGGPTDFSIEARDQAILEWQGTHPVGAGSMTAWGATAIYAR
jgi:hypothetical protein